MIKNYHPVNIELMFTADNFIHNGNIVVVINIICMLLFSN